MRGGYLRTAAEQYIGKMNPDHWPVLDWITMGYFYEKLIITDGSYRPTVPWLLESLTYENPTTAVTKLRDGITFQDGTKFDAAAMKFVIDWIRDPKSGAWSVSWLAPLDTDRGRGRADPALALQDALGGVPRSHRQRSGLHDVPDRAQERSEQLGQPPGRHRTVHSGGGQPRQFREG